MTHDNSESSLLFSLAELERIERERIEGEAQRAQHEQRRVERAARAAEGERRRVEQARLERQRQEQAELERREEEARVREQVQQRAAVERAHIAEQARLRLQAEERERAHQLTVLRTRLEAGGRRWSGLLAVCLVLVTGLGALTLWSRAGEVGRLEAELERLRGQRVELASERTVAARVLLSVVDDHMTTLANRGDQMHARELGQAAMGLRSRLGDDPFASGLQRELSAELRRWDDQLWHQLQLQLQSQEDSPRTRSRPPTGPLPQQTIVRPPPPPCEEGDPLCERNPRVRHQP